MQNAGNLAGSFHSLGFRNFGVFARLPPSICAALHHLFFNQEPGFQCSDICTFVAGSGSCERSMPLKAPRAPGTLESEQRGDRDAPPELPPTICCSLQL